MTVARVVGRKRSVALERTDVERLRDEHTRVVVDLGTGDGRYAYAIAGVHPDWLVVGIDALDEPMGETAARAARKPARGGRPNVVYVHSSVESPPEELCGVADEVTVLLPWGRLLEGIVLGEPDVIAGIAAIARPGAAVVVVLNGEIWDDSLPVRFAHLPVPTPGYVAESIAPGFAAAGITVGTARYLDADEAAALPTTWARRLRHGRPHPKFVQFAGVRDRAT